jgi:hypothetical protein
MELAQNSPKTPIQTADELALIKLKQEEYISYCAVGGLITEVDGTLKKMSLEQFSDQLKVDRKTLYNWKQTIPKFWDRVEKRRGEIFTQSRISVVWNGLMLRAAKGDAEQAKIILGHYANWQPPTQKTEVRIGGLGDLVNEARKKKIIEGEPSSGNNAE